MIDPAVVGRSFGPFHYRVERERISLLAAALGETNPIFHDLAAARAAGHPDLPAPPTLATCYGLWATPALLAELAALGAPLPRLLHGEQRYQYHTPVHAGDELAAQPAIVAVEPREGRSGRFTLLTLETTLHNQRGELAIVDRLVAVVRAGDPPLPAADGRSPAPPLSRTSGASAAPSPPLPTLEIPPLEPADFVRYAAASGDHNPLHSDPAAARVAGEEGVIAHGMLLMGLLGRVAVALAGPHGLRELAVRFRDKTRPGDALRCGGQVRAAGGGGAGLVEAELWVRDQHGATKATGSLVAAAPRREP